MCRLLEANIRRFSPLRILKRNGTGIRVWGLSHTTAFPTEVIEWPFEDLVTSSAPSRQPGGWESGSMRFPAPNNGIESRAGFSRNFLTRVRPWGRLQFLVHATAPGTGGSGVGRGRSESPWFNEDIVEDGGRASGRSRSVGRASPLRQFAEGGHVCHGPTTSTMPSPVRGRA